MGKDKTQGEDGRQSYSADREREREVNSLDSCHCGWNLKVARPSQVRGPPPHFVSLT